MANIKKLLFEVISSRVFLTFQSASVMLGTVGQEVQTLLDTYCELIPTLTNSTKGGLESDNLAESVSEEFRALYHDTLDCSWDESNPIMGYNLKGASYEDCLMAEANGMSNGNLLDLGTAKCIETIADEIKGTGAFWTSATIVGKDTSILFAERIKVIDGKIAAYHINFDTYPFLSNGDEATDETTGTDIPFVMVLGIIIVVIGSVLWKRNKQYVRL